MEISKHNALIYKWQGNGLRPHKLSGGETEKLNWKEVMNKDTEFNG